MLAACGGNQFVGDHAVIGHELDVFQASFTDLANQWTGFRVQAAEIHDVSTGGADLGDQGAEVFLATGQAFFQHRLDAALGQLGSGGVGQAFAVGVLVVDDRDFLALEHVDDVVASDDALLVVTPAHAEHGAQAAFGHLWVGGAWGDGDDAGFVIHLGGRDGVGGAEVPDHADHFVLVGQAVGHGHGLFGFTRIVAGYQHDFLAVDAAGLVDHIGCRLGTLHVLLTESGVGARHGPRDADLHISLNKRRNTQRRCNGEGQKTFLVKRLGHEWCSDIFDFWHDNLHSNLSLKAQSKARAITFLFFKKTRCHCYFRCFGSIRQDVQPSSVQRCNQWIQKVQPWQVAPATTPINDSSWRCNKRRNGTAHLQCVIATTCTNTD